MALYTQFMDPAQYYLQKQERRDENMRQAMAMMMQMKMQEREWRRQSRLDELSERRVTAYEKAVADQQSQEQKQWQAREIGFRQMFGYGSPEYWRAMSGESISDISSAFPQSTVSTMTEYFKMTPSEWEGLSPTMKRMYFSQYMQNERTGEARAISNVDKTKRYDIDLVEAAINHVRDARQQYEKRYANMRAGGRNLYPLVDKNFEDILNSLSTILRKAIDPNLGPLGEADKLFIERKANTRLSSQNPYYYIPDELINEFKKKEGFTGINNLSNPKGTLMSVTPSPEELGIDATTPAGKVMAGIVSGVREKLSSGAQTITLAQATAKARAAGIPLAAVKAIPTDGGYLVSINNVDYIIPR